MRRLVTNKITDGRIFIRRLGSIFLVGSTFILAGPAYALCAADLSGAADKFAGAAEVCASPIATAPAQAVAQAPIDPMNLPSSVSIALPVTAPGTVPAKVAPGSRNRASYNAMVHRIARAHRIDPQLLAAMVRAESAGRLDAVSNKGALGLLQVMPGTARELGVADPSRLLADPELALTTGARYLKRLQAKLGNDVPIVLAAYNAGPGAVAKAGGIPAYRETQGYVSTIMGRYRQSLLASR